VNLVHTVVRALLLASHLHLPVPVWDGDDVARRGPDRACPAEASANEVDFVLLGLDPPEDPDEGPLDATPDECRDGVCGRRISEADVASKSPRAPRSTVPFAGRVLPVGSPGIPVTPRSPFALFGVQRWRQALAVVLC
jgi:hypothetical protein